MVNSEQAQTASVRIQREGTTAWLIFDHIKRRNAMTLQMWQQVPDLCAELAQDPQVRVVIMRGAGDQAFVAGADISQFTTERTPDKADLYNQATAAASAAIEAIPKPVIAMIQGFCIGGGLALALAADIRYGNDVSQFALPPAKLGIGYGAPGIADLVDLVGPSVTKEIIYTADLFDAQKALRWGLLNAVYDSATLLGSVKAIADVMSSRAPLSQTAAKLAVNNYVRSGHGETSNDVTQAITRCMNSSDYEEGVAAFLAKRPPQFSGS